MISKVYRLGTYSYRHTKQNAILSSDGKARRRRAASMSDSEIMTILIMFHFYYSKIGKFSYYRVSFCAIIALYCIK